MAKSISVPTLTVERLSGPERIEYSITDKDVVSIGVNGRGYSISLNAEGELYIEARAGWNAPDLTVQYAGYAAVRLRIKRYLQS